jgi:hypothetical protein
VDLWSAFRRRPVVPLALAFAFFTGVTLRLVYPADIEYKGDERYSFDAAMAVLHGAPWPRLGMDSGVSLKNPGLSVWAFVVLAKLFGATTPIDLARAVQWTSIAALALLGIFILRAVPREDGEPWLWGLALACVNPFDVLLQRKIWAPSLFPLLSLAVLAGWWFRERRRGAFVWGLAGALLGQIEMGGGFFLAMAYVVGTLVATRGRGMRWGAWLAGSVLGVVPMLPWLSYVMTELRHGLPHAAPGFFLAFSIAHHPLSSWIDRIPGQFWWVWITGAAGFGLDYSFHGEIWRFLASPFIGARGTYACAGATTLAALGVIAILLRFVRVAFRDRAAWLRGSLRALVGLRVESRTWHAIAIALFWFGLLFTLSPFFLHRHYLAVAFPFQGVWLAKVALPSSESAANDGHPARVGRILLGTVAAALLGISVFLLADVHAHGGVPRGDFGVSFGALR